MGKLAFPKKLRLLPSLILLASTAIACSLVYKTLHTSKSSVSQCASPYTRVAVTEGGVSVAHATCGGADASTMCADRHEEGNPTNSRLISLLIYNNEEDLMDARLLETYDIVDMFVIIEAPFTFRGDPKPLHFQGALCRRFAAFAGKIVHIVIEQDAVDPAMEDAAWHREFQSRLAFQRAADKLGIRDNEIIFQSDTDELPTAAALETAKNILSNGLSADGVPIPVVDLHMQAYSFSLSHIVEGPDTRMDGSPCCKVLHDRAKVFHYSARHTCTFQSIRSDWKTDSCPEAKNLVGIDNAGIHATYFLSPDDVLLKLKSYAHDEFDRPLNVTQMVAEEKDPQGWWMRRSDPSTDTIVMWFKPATRALLLSQTMELDRLQQAALT